MLLSYDGCRPRSDTVLAGAYRPRGSEIERKLFFFPFDIISDIMRSLINANVVSGSGAEPIKLRLREDKRG